MSLSQDSRCLSCQHGHDLRVLLPHLAGTVVQEAELTGGLLCIRARARADEAICPSCERASRRVHSRYERRLADAPVGGRRVVIRLQVRRLFCDVPACAKRTFAEQVPGLTARYGRKTALLAGMQQDIAVALAGRAGCRLAGRLSVPASRQVLLRLVMAVPDPAAPAPRVLGVDDFAIRRGQNYGTVLIDCQSGVPLDLLAGREAGPLADWLAARPGIEVICRDRSGAYADGARTGAPGAVQVADRFHLWQNLAKAVEKCVAAHRACLAEPVLSPASADEPGPAPAVAEAGRPEPSGKYADRARRHQAIVHDLLAQGRGLREIARHLGWGLHTVQRYARAATWQELADGRWQQPRPSKLDSFKPPWTSAPDRAAATAPSCSGRSASSAKTAATPSSATTSTSAAPPRRRCRRPRPPSGTSPAGSPATRTPSPTTSAVSSRPCWTAAPSSAPPTPRSARSPSCSPGSPARTSRSGSAAPRPPPCPACPPSPKVSSRTSTP